MLGFNPCSDKIAAKAGDVFSGMKAKINKSIETIQSGMNNQIGLLAKAEEEVAKLKSGIAKDEANIKLLKAKSDALDTLI
ncbi:hypothetical protein vBAbaPP1_28 [Acinetobacter phage vB_AbaM_P1]|nr:hypothetical protein vBAbaPP1_28 [Acinetobacter phage vB_AbaM_P1]